MELFGTINQPRNVLKEFKVFFIVIVTKMGNRTEYMRQYQKQRYNTDPIFRSKKKQLVNKRYFFKRLATILSRKLDIMYISTF